MKIALIAPTSEPTSCATRLFMNYARAMAAHGHAVTVFFPGPIASPCRVDNEQVRVCSCPHWLSSLSIRGGFGPGEVAYKCVQLLAHRFDFIHVCPGHRPANLVSAWLAKHIRGSMIVDEWWEWFGRGGCADQRKGIVGACVAIYDSLVELPSKHVYDGVIAITRGLRSRLRGHAHVDVLPGGAEVNALTKFDLAESRRALGLDENLLILGMSGLTDNDHNDNMPLFDAVRHLSKEVPNLRLLATGDSAYIAERVQPVLSPEVLLNVGWVDFGAYNRHLTACDAFMLPFPDTGRNRCRWPNKIGDYLALDRPIITNPTGDLASLSTEYERIHLCPNTSAAYQAAIRTLAGGQLQKAPRRPRSQGRVLSFDGRVDRILAFYEQLQMHRRTTA